MKRKTNKKKKPKKFTHFRVEKLYEYITAAEYEHQPQLTNDIFLVRSIESQTCRENTLLVQNDGTLIKTRQTIKALFLDYQEKHGLDDEQMILQTLAECDNDSRKQCPYFTIWHCFTRITDELYLNVTNLEEYLRIPKKQNSSMNTRVINGRGISADISKRTHNFQKHFLRDLCLFLKYRYVKQYDYCEDPRTFSVFKQPTPLNHFLIKEAQRYELNYQTPPIEWEEARGKVRYMQPLLDSDTIKEEDLQLCFQTERLYNSPSNQTDPDAGSFESASSCRKPRRKRSKR